MARSATRSRAVAVGVALVLSGGLAACSSDDDGDVASTDASAVEASTTTTERRTTTEAAGGTTTEPGGSGTTLAEDEGDEAAPGERDSWTANAALYRGQDGARFTYRCPPDGTASTVWGTDVYTDDSSVCTAAVHLGRITLEGGGTVEIEIRPGEGSYQGSERNGITSFDYGSWGGSYVFVG
jgi:hypothetical protein